MATPRVTAVVTQVEVQTPIQWRFTQACVQVEIGPKDIALSLKRRFGPAAQSI